MQKGAMSRGQRYPGAPGLQGGVYPAHPHYSIPFPLQQQQQALGVGQSGRRTTGAGASQQRTVVGPCFACGEMGHLRTYCPRAQTSEKKWYPHQIFVCVPERVWEGASTCHRGPPGVGKLPDANDCDAVSGTSSSSCSSVETSIDLEKSISDSDTGDSDNSVGEFAGRVGGDADSSQGAKSGQPTVKGRLKECLPFWREEIKAPASILRIIECGYVLPLMQEPPTFQGNNRPFAYKHAAFVEESLGELLSSECVVPVAKVPHVCSPLSVVVNRTGKKRLVVNLRYLNRFLWKQKFKYEDLRVAMLLLKQGDLLFSFDLKSGYHHVDICKEHWKYLGFSWKGQCYVFTVLPFGLSSACYIFTKLVRPLVGYWRKVGLRIIVYLHDGLCAVTGEADAHKASMFVRVALDKSGFLANKQKSIWTPTKRLKWLGFMLDMEKGHIEVPAERLAATRKKLDETCALNRIQARQLASIVGSIISMGLAVGPLTRFMTRSMYALLNSRQSWSTMLTISSEAQQEMLFWWDCLAVHCGQPIWHSPSAVQVVYSDASETGYGGYVVEHGTCSSFGQWTESEAQQSSTWRELAAVLQVLRGVASKLTNHRVRWFTDNQNVGW